MDRAEFAGAGEGGEGLDAGVMKPDVADEEAPVGARGQVPGFGEIGGEGFFTEHALSAREQGGDDGGAGGGGVGLDHRDGVAEGEQVAQTVASPDSVADEREMEDGNMVRLGGRF